MKTVQMSLLFDFYGELLTERQRHFFSLYFGDDLSLGEIAEQHGVSRQAVYDMLRRASGALEGYEKKLNLVERFRAEDHYLQDIKRYITKAIDALTRCHGLQSDARTQGKTDFDQLHDARQALEKALHSWTMLRESRFD